MLQPGDRMPEFALRDSSREKFTQENLAGSPAVVAFFPMAFTGGWTQEMEGFQQRYGELRDLGAHVVGVSSDTWASLGAFEDEIEAEFPLLSDWPNYETIATFGVGREQGPTARRVTFVFDAEGALREVIDNEQDMSAHAAGAVEALQRLSDSGE